jgi:uroporphyrin-III C-methyltransferase/precorrin-2 dehydrogenase/sirohydrochlorin ferrochelatase
MNATMPAVLVERATQRDERRIVATIADMPEQAKLAHPDGPCLLMIGLVFAPLLADAGERASIAGIPV